MNLGVLVCCDIDMMIDGGDGCSGNLMILLCLISVLMNSIGIVVMLKLLCISCMIIEIDGDLVMCVFDSGMLCVCVSVWMMFFSV